MMQGSAIAFIGLNRRRAAPRFSDACAGSSPVGFDGVRRVSLCRFGSASEKQAGSQCCGRVWSATLGHAGQGEAQTFIRQEPSTSAPHIVRVTSRPLGTCGSQNSFIPIETPACPYGSVMEELFERDTWVNTKCIIWRQPTLRAARHAVSRSWLMEVRVIRSALLQGAEMVAEELLKSCMQSFGLTQVL